MNRADRRRIEKSNRKSGTQKITEAQKAGIEVARVEFNHLIEEYYTNILACCLMVLHDKYGFGKQRLDDFRRDVYFNVECIADNHLSITDIEQTLEAECYKDGKILPVSELLKARIPNYEC